MVRKTVGHKSRSYYYGTSILSPIGCPMHYNFQLPGYCSRVYGHGLYKRKKAEALILRSVQLAEEAIKRFQSSATKKIQPLIAASIGPYGAYLADGSEYHGNYGISEESLHDFHWPRIQILDSSNADFFACETIPSFQEVKVLSQILTKTKKPAWITFSCKDENHLNDGTPIRECVAFLEGHENVFAVGVNCTAPKYISGLIRNIKSETSTKEIVVYPNSGEAYNVESKTWLGTAEPVSFSAMAKEWMELGAGIIGGCCRIGPEHIQFMKELMTKD